jgi:hypothetical protein
MRTIHLGILVVALLSLPATHAAGQSSSILNIVELQNLVASGTPGDNARLAAHFTALADQSASEATRHQTMATGFGINPNRQLGSQMAPHCNRLAKLSEEAAVALRELASHHTKLAAGVSSTAPANASAYQSGKGARVPTENDLKALAAKASTAADHRALMEYFSETTKRHTAAERDHVQMAQAYRGSARFPWAGPHCDRMVALSRDAAKEATAAAAMHKDLAALPR